MLLVLLGVLMSVVVPVAEGGGYADSLKAASLVMQEKITVEPNVSAPTNNTVGGLPYRTAYHFQPKGHWMNGMDSRILFRSLNSAKIHL